jgi:hypothetical protein
MTTALYRSINRYRAVVVFIQYRGSVESIGLLGARLSHDLVKLPSKQRDAEKASDPGDEFELVHRLREEVVRSALDRSFVIR